jgi:hypothetical protein
MRKIDYRRKDCDNFVAHDVFISYSSKDKTVANAVCAKLESRNIRCWIAPRDILPGNIYAEALVDALDQSRILILIFSANSNNSTQVMREVERAVRLGIPILPFRIEDVLPSKAMEYFLSAPHWLDALTPPLERHLDILGRTIETLLTSNDPQIKIREESHEHTNLKSKNRKSIGIKYIIFGSSLILVIIFAVFFVLNFFPKQNDLLNFTLPTSSHSPIANMNNALDVNKSPTTSLTNTPSIINKPAGITNIAIADIKYSMIDYFNDVNSGWPSFVTTNYEGKYFSTEHPSYYYLSGKNIGGNYYIQKNMMNEYTNFIVQIEATIENEKVDGGYGLSFRRNTNGTAHYMVWIFPLSKRYFISRVQNETIMATMAVGSSPAIKSDSLQINRLTLDCRNAIFNLYINDQLIASAEDDTYSSGRICLGISNNAEHNLVKVRFYSFKFVDLTK